MSDAQMNPHVVAALNQLASVYAREGETMAQMLIRAANSLERAARLQGEVHRLKDVLDRIAGGDKPCRDEMRLRQWAFEGLLGRSVEELSDE